MAGRLGCNTGSEKIRSFVKYSFVRNPQIITNLAKRMLRGTNEKLEMFIAGKKQWIDAKGVADYRNAEAGD